MTEAAVQGEDGDRGHPEGGAVLCPGGASEVAYGVPGSCSPPKRS